MEMLMYIYTKTSREGDLPVKELSGSQLTGWICDVLHGAGATDPQLKEDIEASRVAALDCLTSLLINAQVNAGDESLVVTTMHVPGIWIILCLIKFEGVGPSKLGWGKGL